MLKREAPVPLYYQIELQLREAIDAGRYGPGDRLPTETELQRQFDVSRVTVRSALRRLEEDGLISTQRGRGTFVSSQAAEGRKIERNPARLLAFEEDLLRHGANPRVDVLAVERGPVPRRIGGLLELSAGEEVLRLRRLGWVDDAPLWLESRFFHPSVGNTLAEQDLSSASVTALLQDVMGLHVDSTRLRVSAGAATRDQAQHLGLATGDPVLINEFAVYANGHAVEAARAVFRADRYAFTFEAFPSHESADRALRSAREPFPAFSFTHEEVSA